MTTWLVSGTIGFVAGGAAIWFGKTKLQELVIGANALSAKLHAKADELRAKV